MKQPELGQTVLRLRKEMKLTQEELVERCNINVRTLQRIESGEVTPRDYTTRSLFSALNFDIDQIEQSLSFKADMQWIKLSWIAGIIYFILGIAEFVIDYTRFEDDLPYYFPFIYSLVKMLCMVSFVVFMMGFASAGRAMDKVILRISAFLMIGMVAIVEVHDIVSLFSGISEVDFYSIKGIEAVMLGAVGLPFAYGIFMLHDQIGILAKVTGIIEAIIGVLFLSFILAVVGLFLIIPITVMEIIILYQIYDKLQKRDLI